MERAKFTCNLFHARIPLPVNKRCTFVFCLWKFGSKYGLYCSCCFSHLRQTRLGHVAMMRQLLRPNLLKHPAATTKKPLLLQHQRRVINVLAITITAAVIAQVVAALFLAAAVVLCLSAKKCRRFPIFLLAMRAAAVRRFISPITCPKPFTYLFGSRPK